MLHVYDVLLRLFPTTFRRRYAAEMSLDFEDALDAARRGGWTAVAACAGRAFRDLAMSLVREWTRSGRLVLGAVAAASTLLLWALALRPWGWKWDLQPGPPAHARTAPPVTEVELLVLALLALVIVVVVILFAGGLTRSLSPRARRHG